MAPSEFANANLDDVVDSLTIDEAVRLTTGVGFWRTAGVPRLNIPAIKVSDGPNGIRGNHFFMGTPAKCLPSATALGATWDPELVSIVGQKLLGEEAKLRAASVILAPTVNIQRSPLGGRSFESFSEDPTLSGLIAAGYINGVQRHGIGCCIKHFVANDQENDRMALDSIVSPRALREIYLMPFMLAQKYANPWAYMTSYGKLNGTHCSHNKWLLDDLLRKEWSSDALVMSDWFGVYSVAPSINAGLDLEMPGVDGWRQLTKMIRSIGARTVTERTVRQRARKVLELTQKSCKGAPELLDGDGSERTVDSKEDRTLMQSVAAQSIVLLKNENSLLPLDVSKLTGKTVAIVGGNAKAHVLSGGGSAALKPSFVITPFDGIVSALGPDVNVVYAEGARATMTLPTLDYDIETASGSRGWTISYFKSGASYEPLGHAIRVQDVDETNIFVADSYPEELPHAWTATLEGFLTPRTSDGDFEFGLTVAGRAKLFVDGQLIVDNWTLQRRGQSFYGLGSEEERGKFCVKAGTRHSLKVVFSNVKGPAKGDPDEPLMIDQSAVRLGGAFVIDDEKEMDNAITLASKADLVVAVVGLNADWETEGYDRTTLALPGRTDELISRVVQTNAHTIVVTQSGSAITMPWASSVKAIVHAWYLGNATGGAIADVLLGKVNPGGKLSLTFPKQLQDVPSFGSYGSQNGVVRYGEDVFVGYKHYHNTGIEVLFPFGHGLSYTTFEYSNLQISSTSYAERDVQVTVTIKITNTGLVAGSEIIQLYVSPTAAGYRDSLQHPVRALRAFSKVKDLAPGASAEVRLILDKYAFSYWEERYDSWVVQKGIYQLIAAASADDLRMKGTVELPKGFEWNGL